MQTDVLVLDHDAASLEAVLHVEILREIPRRRVEPIAQIGFLAIRREGDAIHRTDVDTGVAFDAKLCRKHRLNVAIQTSAGFHERQLFVKAQFDLSLDIPERNDLVAMRYLVALVEGNLVVIAPLMDAHFLTHYLDCRSRAVGDVIAIEKFVDRNGSLVPVSDGPDDVLRTKRRVTTKEH